MFARRQTEDGQRRQTGASRTQTRSSSAALPLDLVEALAVDPRFAVISSDGRHWFCPYTLVAVPCPKGAQEAAYSHLLDSGAWRSGPLQLVEEVRAARWRHDLPGMLARDRRLCLFTADGAWIHPATGEREDAVRQRAEGIDDETIAAMASVLAREDHLSLLGEDVLLGYAGAGAAIGHASSGSGGVRARDVQRRLLGALPRIPGLALDVRYEPADEVGGDFYDVLRLSDTRLLLVMGDVSGHGVQAALHVASALKTLRMLAREHREPVDLLCRLNDELRTDMVPGQFATAALVEIDLETRSARCLLAGHHPLALIRPAGPLVLRCVGRPGPALGLLAGERFRNGLRSEVVQLEPGELLVLYSDALEEARRQGVEFGRLRLQGALLAGAGGGPAGLVDAAVEAVLDWCSAAPGDDLTILACMLQDAQDGRSTHTAAVR